MIADDIDKEGFIIVPRHPQEGVSIFDCEGGKADILADLFVFKMLVRLVRERLRMAEADAKLSPYANALAIEFRFILDGVGLLPVQAGQTPTIPTTWPAQAQRCERCDNPIEACGCIGGPRLMPIPMLLYCPNVASDKRVCGARHIDEGEFATRPHKTHTCQICGGHFQPALVPTVGVKFLPGCESDAPIANKQRSDVPYDGPGAAGPTYEALQEAAKKYHTTLGEIAGALGMREWTWNERGSSLDVVGRVQSLVREIQALGRMIRTTVHK